VSVYSVAEVEAFFIAPIPFRYVYLLSLSLYRGGIILLLALPEAAASRVVSAAPPGLGGAYYYVPVGVDP
jgi:hypothetical protein